jgi:acyl-coenzyme A thioesterase PaaI-like protein
MGGRGSEERPDPPPFFTRYGISRTDDPRAPLVIEPYAEVCRGGVLRPTVLAAAVDIVGSLFGREVAGSDHLFTTDLSVRAPARPAPRRIVTRGELLRAGRSVIASEVVLEADGVPFACGQTSFRRLPRAEGSVPREELARLVAPEVIERETLDRPLAHEAGVVVADASRGRVELPLCEALLTPGGVLQGALVALVVEEAALALAEHADAGLHVVTELDVRYLAPGREGPIVSSAHWVTDRESAMMRVALRDVGSGDRITTAALARVTPAPAHRGPGRR